MIHKIRFSHNETKIIHSSLDYHDAVLYKGVLLPTMVRNRYKDLPYLVTSNRDLILLTSKKQLQKHNVKIKDNLTKSSNWDLDSIERYLKDGIRASSVMLFQDITKTLRSYLDLGSDENYTILSLWIMSTYVFPIFDAMPIIYINGERGTGKSKCLQLCSLLVHNPLYTSNISPSAIFRLIEGTRPTILLDEAELLKSKQYGHMVNVLLSGYKKGGINHRAGGINSVFDTKSYDTYSPKMIASINRVGNSALSDRCINIETIRSSNKEVMARDINANDTTFARIRNLLHVWSMNNANRVHKIYTTIESPHPQLSGRRWEIWKCLLTIHSVTSLQKDGMLARYAIEMNKHNNDDGMSADKVIVQVLANNVKRSGYIRNKDIYTWFSDSVVNDESMHWIKPNHLGYLLRDLGINNKRNLGGNGIGYFISLKKIKDMKRVYELA